MKGNEKYVLVGAVIIAALLVFASYKFFYSADVEKADQVQNEINALQVRMDELNAKNANRSMYEAGIANSRDIIDTVLSIYGPGNSPEKTIMMVVDLCHKTGISVSDISFSEDMLVYATNATMDENGVLVANIDENGQTVPMTEDDIQVYKAGMAMRISSGYTQLKKLTDYINSHPERMNAENFTVNFNAETGKLETTINVNLYGVLDKNHKYEAPVIEDIELGSENIFKTAEQVVEEEEEGEEENAEADSNNKPAGNKEENNEDNNEAAGAEGENP